MPQDQSPGEDVGRAAACLIVSFFAAALGAGDAETFGSCERSADIGFGASGWAI